MLQIIKEIFLFILDEIFGDKNEQRSPEVFDLDVDTEIDDDDTDCLEIVWCETTWTDGRPDKLTFGALPQRRQTKEKRQ